MTRREQAIQELETYDFKDDEVSRYMFLQGVEWADNNPVNQEVENSKLEELDRFILEHNFIYMTILCTTVLCGFIYLPIVIWAICSSIR